MMVYVMTRSFPWVTANAISPAQVIYLLRPYYVSQCLFDYDALDANSL